MPGSRLCRFQPGVKEHHTSTRFLLFLVRLKPARSHCSMGAVMEEDNLDICQHELHSQDIRSKAPHFSLRTPDEHAL
eukprot:1157556-Pelagomonas_calceolata.AAC.8